jgi:cell division protein FtsB
VSPAETPARSDSFRPVLGAILLLVLALLAIAALKSSRDLESARARERLLQARIAETRARSERLRVRIDRLRHDPGMLERLAREDLGMVRPGDVIIELPAAAPHLPGPPRKQPNSFPSLPRGERNQGSEGPARTVTPTGPPGAPPPPPPAPALPSAGLPAPESP